MPALEGSALPRGHNIASGTITPDGKVKFTGYTAAGTKWSHSTLITESVRLPWLAAQAASDGTPGTSTPHARVKNPERALGEVSIYWVGKVKGANEILLSRCYYGERFEGMSGNAINGKDGAPTYVFRGPVRVARSASGKGVWYSAGYEISNVEGVGASYANYGFNQLGSLGLDSALADNARVEFNGSDTWNYGKNTTPINTYNSLTLNPKGQLIQPSTSSHISKGKFNVKNGLLSGVNQATYYRLDYNRTGADLDDLEDWIPDFDWNSDWDDDGPQDWLPDDGGRDWWAIRQHASIFPEFTKIVFLDDNAHPDAHPGNENFCTYPENDDNPLARPLPFPNRQGAKVNKLFPVDFPTNNQFVGVAADEYEAGGVQLERNLTPTSQEQVSFTIKKKYFKVGARGGVLPLTVVAPLGQSFSMAFKPHPKGIFKEQNDLPYYPNKLMYSGVNDALGRPIFVNTIYPDTLNFVPPGLRPDLESPDTNLDGVRDNAGLWIQGVYMGHATLGMDQTFNIYVQPWDYNWAQQGVSTINRYEILVGGQTVVIEQFPYNL